MRLLLYEWCCSGGMQSDIAHDILQRTPLEDFLKEGCLMLEALACDAEKNTDLDITVMVDTTLPVTKIPHFSEHITVEKVPAGTNRSFFLPSPLSLTKSFSLRQKLTAFCSSPSSP